MNSLRFAIVGLVALAVLTFLLPFAEFTYTGTPVSQVSGLQLATGTRLSTESFSPGMEPLELPPQPVVGVSLLLLLTSLAAADKRSRTTHIKVGLLSAAGALLGLLVLVMQMPIDALPQNPGLFAFSAAPGIWLAMIVAAAQVAVAVRQLRFSQSEAYVPTPSKPTARAAPEHI